MCICLISYFIPVWLSQIFSQLAFDYGFIILIMMNREFLVIIKNRKLHCEVQQVDVPKEQPCYFVLNHLVNYIDCPLNINHIANTTLLVPSSSLPCKFTVF
jgi:hypothetical protein